MHPVPVWHCRWKHLAIIAPFPTSDNTTTSLAPSTCTFFLYTGKVEKRKSQYVFLTRGDVVWSSLLTAFNA